MLVTLQPPQNHRDRQGPIQNNSVSPRPIISPSNTPRKFENFLSAFELYGEDNFTPADFNTWTGISIIAGALERKVWLQWNQTLRYYPNMYVMLVSLPGVGKSTALNRGVSLLEELYRENRRVNFMPTQVTEAKLIELMTQKAHFTWKGQTHYHCSGYYYASEASDSLKEIYGDITSTMTNLYDCPDLWQKATKKDGMVSIENGCFNLLAGSTMQYLGVLVNDSNIMGGFASRINYIVGVNKEAKQNQFPTDFEAVDELKKEYKAKLVHDLKRINEMVGPYSSTPEFREAWAEWDFAWQKKRLGLGSEKMQTLMVRMGTSMHKLCMVLSAAESSDRVLKLPHFERAKALLEKAEGNLPGIFREAKANNTASPDSLRNALLMLMTQGQKQTKRGLTSVLVMKGFDPRMVDALVASMLANKTLELVGEELKLLIDANKYF